MKVSLGISNRHVHLTEKTYKELFGNEPLEVVKYLKQPGQFASNKFLTIKTEANEINHVRVIGPFRDYNQIEISRTDSYHLKINPPIRDSGDIKNSEPITLINGSKIVHLNEGCIIANRHIHITPKEVEEYGFTNVKKVKIRINGEKPGIIENVYLKIAEKSAFELHLDTDDANAFNLKNEDELEIIEMEKE